MSTITTRLQNDGTLLLNGEFDEFTGATIANDDLMFWLDATQTASYPGTGDTWFSLINSANTATLTNGAAFVNTSGGVITFDGTDDYADFTSPGLGTGTAVITVELWANIKTIGARMPFGFNRYDVYLNGGRLAYNTGNSDQYGIDSATYTATNAIGNVAHYCFVMYNNTSLSGIPYTNNKIYINGISQTLSQLVGTQSATTRTFNNGIGRISGWTSDTNYPANMDLAVFRIYDRELTTTEVATNFNSQCGRYGLTPISNTPPIFRVTSNTVLAAQFDEVTYNLTAPTIVNFISYSQDLTNPVWEKSAGGTAIAPVITANYAEAPDGTMTADLVAFDSGGSGNSQLANGGVGAQPTAGTTRTWSVYMRTLTGTTTISMFNGDNVTTRTVTSSWQRFSYTVTFGGGSIFGVRLAKREVWGTGGAANVLVWGGQWEWGSVATIYQPIAAANTLVNTGMGQRVDSSGNQYVSNIFDEFTGAPVVDSNLVLWLDAGQTTSYPGSGTTWTDLSTNSLNGTLVNTPTFDNQGWIVFDRTQSERVDFGDSASVDFTGTSPYTLEVWVYPLSNYPTLTYAGIFNHESNPGGGRDGWNLYLSGNSAASTTMTFATERFALGSQSAPSFSLNQSVVLNNWHHIVATYDGTNIRMYRNSSLVAGPSASSLSITNTTVNMNIASRGTGSYFDGRISIARIYNQALSGDEVQQNFNANRRRYGL